MKGKTCAYFRNPEIAPGDLGKKLRQFGYRIRQRKGLDTRFVYYDTQDGKLFKRRSRLRLFSEEGRWLLEQEGAIAEWVPTSEELRNITGGRPVFPVLRARVMEEGFRVSAPQGSELALAFQKWVFSPPFAEEGPGSGDSRSGDVRTLELIALCALQQAQGAAHGAMRGAAQHFVPHQSHGAAQLTEIVPEESGEGNLDAEFSCLSIQLHDLMGLSPFEPDPFIFGIEELDLPLPGAPVPARYTVLKKDSLSVVIGKVLGAQAYKMRANTEGTARDLDPEFLHDLRVAVRRARFALKYARLVAGRDRCDALREALALIADHLGEVRDMDVFSLGLREQFERVRAPEDARRAILEKITERRARAFGELREALQSVRYKTALEDLGSFLASGDAETAAPRDSAIEVAPALVKKALKKVKKTGKERAAEFTPEVLHRLRIAFKGLRYACEFFFPLFGEGMAGAIKMMVEFQDCLGRYQDALIAAAVLKEILDSFLTPGNAGGAGLGAPSGAPEDLEGSDLPTSRPDPSTLFTLGALTQLQREIALGEQRRFSDLWEAFPVLARRLRALAKG